MDASSRTWLVLLLQIQAQTQAQVTPRKTLAVILTSFHQ